MGRGVGVASVLGAEERSGRPAAASVGSRTPESRTPGRKQQQQQAQAQAAAAAAAGSLPLVVALNCMDDCRAEARALEGVAMVEHVGLAQVGEGKIEAAVAVLVQSLAYLPRAAQRRLQPWQLILSLGSADKGGDSGLAGELGLQLLHVDSGRSEEVADTAMALILGLLRRTPALAAQAGASAGWLGALPAACRGMRRCRGQVLGIVGSTASARALAARCLAFKMTVIYLDIDDGPDGGQQPRRGGSFPPQVTAVQTLRELLSLSDVVSLHCPLTNETVQIINAETIKFVKPGAMIVNTSSSHLLDDCALKEALIEGILAGCALDGVEGPQWLEAWVREMPNVLILPKSADYSEEVWAEIRAKAVSVLRSFLLEGVVPVDAAASEEDDEDEASSVWTEEKPPDEAEEKESGRASKERGGELRSTGESQSGQDFRQHKQMSFQSQEPLVPSSAQDPDSSSHGLVQRESSDHNVKVSSSSSGKKGKKRAGRRKATAAVGQTPQLPSASAATAREDQPWGRESGIGPAPSSAAKDANPKPRYGSPTRRRESAESASSLAQPPETNASPGLALDQLKEGQIVALRARAGGGFYAARQKGPGRGWRLDMIADVTHRDPAAQFLVVVRNRDRIGLRSLAAGGKLLQANRKLELVFVNHTFDVWESWIVEGADLKECKLTNSKFRGVSLDVCVEILAAVGDDDGVARWLS